MNPVSKVIKASGETEPYDDRKFLSSLLRAGVPEDSATRVASEVRPRLRGAVDTGEIHRSAHQLLLREGARYAGRYQLKRAMLELGPSGFPFEKFLSGVLRHHGYTCTLNSIVPGRCVSHEIDLIATDPAGSAWVECKYHNHPGMKTDVKTALYCYARYLDLQDGPRSVPGRAFWIFTNTKFTSEALKYGECVSMKLTGWNYPPKRPLQSLIESARLYPVTCLSSLKPEQQQRLLASGTTLISELRDDPALLRGLRLAPDAVARVQAEIEALSSPAP